MTIFLYLHWSDRNTQSSEWSPNNPERVKSRTTRLNCHILFSFLHFFDLLLCADQKKKFHWTRWVGLTETKRGVINDSDAMRSVNAARARSLPLWNQTGRLFSVSATRKRALQWKSPPARLDYPGLKSNTPASCCWEDRCWRACS